MQVYRAWINQPSELQLLHTLDGVRCIVVDKPNDSCVDIYFTDGEIHSMRVPRLCVSRYNLSKTFHG